MEFLTVFYVHLGCSGLLFLALLSAFCSRWRREHPKSRGRNGSGRKDVSGSGRREVGESEIESGTNDSGRDRSRRDRSRSRDRKRDRS